MLKILASFLFAFFTFNSALKAASPMVIQVPGGNTYRTFHISTPIVSIGAERILHMELNAAMIGSWALEASWVGKAEEYSEKEVQESGRSLLTKGFEGSLHFARFSEPALMGGFYWSLGMGYRKMDADFVRPQGDAYAPTGLELYNDAGLLVSSAEGTGMTGHGRLGYRYVATTWPFLIGVGVGLRHFESKYENLKSDGGTPLTDEEQIQLKNLTMTRLEGGVEIGLTF